LSTVKNKDIFIFAAHCYCGEVKMLSLRKKILVAIDGSPMSDKAAEEAVRLAAGNQGQFKSKVYAMLVLPNAPRTTFTDFVPPKPVTETEKWEEIRTKIFFVVEKTAEEAGIPLEVKVAHGDPAVELLAFSERENIDVIVIGSTGKGFIRRKVLYVVRG
jgi:nucleotide-binding universal stress UspA family protein